MRNNNVLLVVLVFFALALVDAHAENGCVALTYTISGSIPPNVYRYYELNLLQSGKVVIQVDPDVYSNVPVKLAFLDAISLTEIVSSSTSNHLLQSLSVEIHTPRKVGVALFNPSSFAASVTGKVNVTLCGNPAIAWALNRSYAISTTSLGLAAPVGIVDNGLSFINGTYATYSYDFSAARAEVEFSPNFRSTSYDYPRYTTGSSVQLNLNLQVVTIQGSLQFYWVQEVLIIEGDKTYTSINIWNMTRILKDEACTLSPLSPAAITGNGIVRYYEGTRGGCAGYLYGYAEPSLKPLGATTLEVHVTVAAGKVQIRFLRDGSLVDFVTISPSQGASYASFTVKPLLWEWSPIDAELVFAGKSGDYPVALLSSGSMKLHLSYLRNNQWFEPVTAWSVGGNTFERAVAVSLSSQPGTVTVSPGSPKMHLLWSSLVAIKTPLGVNFSTTLDISNLIRRIIDFGNGTRLVQPEVYVDGKPFNGTKVWPGAVVEIRYTKQHLIRLIIPDKTLDTWVNQGAKVSSLIPEFITIGVGARYKLEKITYNGLEVALDSEIRAPGELRGYYKKQYLVTVKSLNTTTLWADDGIPIATLVPPIIDFGNRTRLAKPTVTYNNSRWNLTDAEIIGPGTYQVHYTRQYLCTITTLEGTSSSWLDQNFTLTLQPHTLRIGGVSYTPSAYIVNGVKTRQKTLKVEKPLEIRVAYNATATMDASSLGLPALYAEARLQCGPKPTQKTYLFAYTLELSITDVQTADCNVTTTIIPLWPLLLAVILVLSVAVALRARQRREVDFQIVQF